MVIVRTPALAAPGTRLRDLPPDWRGLSWGAYQESLWAEWIAAAAAARDPEAAAAIAAKPIATPRDRYGWRSLPAGSLYLGGPRS